jgi:hypothetical protein
MNSCTWLEVENESECSIPNISPFSRSHYFRQKMSFVATSRATTVGHCGTGEVIPRKRTNSAIYFKAGNFSTGLKCLTHSDKGVEYKRVQERTAWVSYLDRQQEQTSTVDDES